MIREHYANAEVPMLPVVRGDRETARQIAWYTVALVAATLRPGRLRRLRARLRRLRARARGGASRGWRSRSGGRRRRPHAVKLFHYSMLYLALLFVAMALDAVV